MAASTSRSTPAFRHAGWPGSKRAACYAVANLRGGGEYGKAWHDAGRLRQQAERVRRFHRRRRISEGAAHRLAARRSAIEGRSNGGLLIGAVVNQRPGPVRRGRCPAVGVMDMLRFDRFTAGRYWVDDYGYPDQEADFRTLLRLFALSQHQAPACTTRRSLVTTADTDDRVVPGHSFKYISALQARRPRTARRTSSGSRPAPATARASRPTRSSRKTPTSTPSSAISPGSISASKRLNCNGFR